MGKQGKRKNSGGQQQQRESRSSLHFGHCHQDAIFEEHMPTFEHKFQGGRAVEDAVLNPVITDDRWAHREIKGFNVKKDETEKLAVVTQAKVPTMRENPPRVMPDHQKSVRRLLEREFVIGDLFPCVAGSPPIQKSHQIKFWAPLVLGQKRALSGPSNLFRVGYPYSTDSELCGHARHVNQFHHVILQ